MAVQSADITWNGRAVSRIIHEAAARGLAVAGEHILTQSRKVVPLDEGTLERSGTVVVDEHELVATIAYDTPYAVRQHEDLEARHAPGRTAKYLEGPMNSERNRAARLIAATIRRATR